MQKTLFLPFKKPAYTTLWWAEGLMNLADQMEYLVLLWLVVENTDSAFPVTLFGGLRFIGMTLAPISGTIIDRYGGLRALKTTRLLYLTYSTSILCILLLNRFKFWIAYFMATFNGVNRASDQVARQTSMAAILDLDDINSGVAGLRIVRDITQIIGPLLGALILNNLGIRWSYVAICSVFLMAALLIFRAASQQSTSTLPSKPTQVLTNSLTESSELHQSSLWTSLKEGLIYVFKIKTLLMLSLLAILYNVAAFPVHYGLIAVIAENIFKTNEIGLGILMSAIYTGALAGTIAIGSVKSFKRPGKVLIIANLAWYLSFVLLSPINVYTAGIIVLVLAGTASGITNVMVEQLLLTISSKEFRGRVMGVRALAVSALFIGVVASGIMTDITNVQVTIAFISILGFITTIFLTVLLPQLWQMKISK